MTGSSPSSGQADFAHAQARRGCTQEDVPALELYFATAPFDDKGDPSPPYLRVEIAATARETLSGTTLTLVPGVRRAAGAAGRLARAELHEPDGAIVWLSGRIVLDQAGPGQDVSGHYDLTAPEGRAFSGGFQAHWNPRPALCG